MDVLNLNVYVDKKNGKIYTTELNNEGKPNFKTYVLEKVEEKPTLESRLEVIEKELKQLRSNKNGQQSFNAGNNVGKKSNPISSGTNGTRSDTQQSKSNDSGQVGSSDNGNGSKLSEVSRD
jgi:hypothetical protein